MFLCYYLHFYSLKKRGWVHIPFSEIEVKDEKRAKLKTLCIIFLGPIAVARNVIKKNIVAKHTCDVTMPTTLQFRWLHVRVRLLRQEFQPYGHIPSSALDA